MINIAILGGSGYTALELIQLLLRHPQVKIAVVTSRQDETPLLDEVHPRLSNRLELRCEKYQIQSLLAHNVHCVFCCLPHGASMAVIPEILAAGIRVIDLSADYRLRDPNQYLQWYGHPHEDQTNLSSAVYGLPEIYRPSITNTNLIANPGCYPQTAILALAPLVQGKWIDESSIIIDSKSGVSGAGRSPKLNFHFPECNEAVSAYGVGTHRHTPEIEQALSDVAKRPIQVTFTPHLIPMDRGIFSTIYVKPSCVKELRDWFELYRDFYRQESFIRIRTNPISTKDSAFTNFVDITLYRVRELLVITAAEDNLIRGASGVAIQNFNLMYGFPETEGLL